MKKKVVVLKLSKHKSEFQFFRHDFINELLSNDFDYFKKGTEKFEQSKLLGLFRKLNLLRLFSSHKKESAILVASQNFGFLKTAFPFIYQYEVIPFLWDCWPDTWEILIRSLNNFRCRIIFVTSSQVAQMLNDSNLKLKAYYIPEGIKINEIINIEKIDFSNRRIDIYELGRIHADYHNQIIKLSNDYKSINIKHNQYDRKGKLTKLAFPKEQDINEILKDVKIVISFPKCDTDSSASGVETLTQRYWESMLNGNLIFGRAPKELIDLIGYDPVININWENPKRQLAKALQNINLYRELIEKNHSTALKYASWSNRITEIKRILEENNYVI